MSKRLDLTGDQYGRLTVIKEFEQKGYTRRWLCKCDCGNEKTVAMNQLRTGKTQSCGCLNKERTSAKNSLDLSGKRFGKLKVLRRSDKKHKTNKVVWECLCDCGNSVDVLSTYLTTGDTTSCGCLKGEKLQNFNKENLTVDDVFIPLLNSKVRADSTTGIKGVTFNERTQKYRATIALKGKRIYLGEYVNKSDAVQARIDGEEKYHKPYLNKKSDPST